MPHPITHRPPSKTVAEYQLYDTRRKGGTLSPIGYAYKDKAGFTYWPANIKSESETRTFRTMKELKDTLEKEPATETVEETPEETARRTADRIDGYDRDDLGESPDF